MGLLRRKRGLNGKKKNSEVAYVPLTPTTEAVAQAPTKIDIPQYPDAGVAFQGYSKKFYGGNNYQLSKQEQLDFNAAVSYLGGETVNNFSRANRMLKDFYCNKIIVSGHSTIGLSTAYFTISDGGTVRLIMSEPVTSTWFMDFDFPTPIKFSKGNYIIFTFSSNRIAGDLLYFNAYGWEEDATQ